jgi:hypothetical protein
MLVRTHVAVTYAKLGKIAEARAMLQESEKAWKPGDGTALWIAAVHARLGEKDRAFEWLESAFQERAAFLCYVRKHPFFADLHDDTRLDALVKRIGIPD